MRGHTLYELMLVLALGATIVAALAPTARRYRDLLYVLAAREALAGLYSRARTEALSNGSSRLVIEAAPRPAAWIELDGRLVGRADPAFLDPVRLELAGGAVRATADFGPLGLGRFANRTIALSRGTVRKELVVSAYGRVRRR